MKFNTNENANIHLNFVEGLYFNSKTKIWRLTNDSSNSDKMQYVLEKNVRLEF